jgi:hypothetical protein
VVGGEIENPEKSSRGKRARREKKREVPHFFCTILRNRYKPKPKSSSPSVRRTNPSFHHTLSLFLITTSQEANARESLLVGYREIPVEHWTYSATLHSEPSVSRVRKLSLLNSPNESQTIDSLVPPRSARMSYRC